MNLTTIDMKLYLRIERQKFKMQTIQLKLISQMSHKAIQMEIKNIRL